MLHRRKRVGVAVAAVATASTLVLANSPAKADFSPQPDDVVTTGSDIIQNSFNFLADGYHELPGYNTAGNRYRFVNFDSSGDAQGRSAFTDPSLVQYSWIYQGEVITEAEYNALSTAEKANAVKYIKQGDIKLLNPTISLRSGQDLVVRPSGGGAGGITALVNDKPDPVTGVGGWIDVGRTPNPPSDTQQNQANTNLGSRLYRVQVAKDRQLIAVSSDSYAPDTITAGDILKIYSGQITTWSQLSNYSGPHGAETIIPLILPTDAGMWTTFVTNVKKQNSLSSDPDLRANPNRIQVQQNDPSSITGLTAAQRPNAIVPFPRGRYKTLLAGYYADPTTTNAYNLPGHRTKLLADGIKLLDLDSTQDVISDSAPYGGDFAYNAIFRASDLASTTPWQPGSTLNWVEALFYNPDGPAPFVKTDAGKALLEAAGVTPEYHVWDGNNAQLQ